MTTTTSSISLALSPPAHLSLPSSLTLSIVCVILPVFSLSLSLSPFLPSLSEFHFKSRSLKGRLQPPQTPQGSSSFFFVALFSPCLFPCLYSICRAPSTAMAGAAHTHIYADTHSKMTHTKPIVAQPSEWLAGKVKCSVISSRQTQSLEMQCQPESPRGMPGLSQKCRQSHKLTALLFPSVSPSSIMGHFYQA